jgi:hypothetical protein
MRAAKSGQAAANTLRLARAVLRSADFGMIASVMGGRVALRFAARP